MSSVLWNPAAFDSARFASLRGQRRLGWGEPLIHRVETGSTNDDALCAAREGARSGSVFVADYQTKGRGRSGKSWQSQPGAGLLFSVLLRPTTNPEQVSSVTLAVGLGLRAALAQLLPSAFAVKWPNDVLAGGRKVAGVLCEGVLEERRIVALVIGAGINLVHQTLPTELERTVTSLQALHEQALPAQPSAIGRERLLVDVLSEIESRVQTCLTQGFAALADEFTQHDALLGRRVAISGSTELHGTARGVDREGRLLVDSDGARVVVRAGTLRLIEG